MFTENGVLALTLLMLWIGTDNKKDALSLHNFALITDFFDGSSYFHILAGSFLAYWLFIAEHDSSLGKVVGTHFQRHAITWQQPDVVYAHATGNMSQNLVTVIETNTKSSAR